LTTESGRTVIGERCISLPCEPKLYERENAEQGACNAIHDVGARGVTLPGALGRGCHDSSVTVRVCRWRWRPGAGRERDGVPGRVRISLGTLTHTVCGLTLLDSWQIWLWCSGRAEVRHDTGNHGCAVVSGNCGFIAGWGGGERPDSLRHLVDQVVVRGVAPRSALEQLAPQPRGVRLGRSTAGCEVSARPQAPRSTCSTLPTGGPSR
jgi:hypothetical protein